MIRIRLRRVGKKKRASFRVVVADSRSPRDGRFIETIGHYNPRTDPPTVNIKEDRARYWLQQGAQPSDAAARLLRQIGVMEKIVWEEEKEAISPIEVSLENLELSARVHKALEEAGITSVGKVLERLEKGEEELLAIPDFGQKSLEEVQQRLRDKGFI